MALDQRHAGNRLGARPLKNLVLKALEVPRAVGVRVLLFHAQDDEAKDCYSHYGFVESPF